MRWFSAARRWTAIFNRTALVGLCSEAARRRERAGREDGVACRCDKKMEKGRGEMGCKENEMHLFMTQKEGKCSRLIASCIFSKEANGRKQVSLVPTVEYLSVE